MLELIKNWALCICVAGIVITIVQILVPKGHISRTLEVVLRIFLLSLLVSPIFFKVDFQVISENNFKKQIEKYSQSMELDMYLMVENELSLYIEEMIKQKLEEIDVTAIDVEVSVIALGNKEARVENVYVVLDSAYKVKEIDLRYVISQIVKCEINIKFVEEI